MKILQLFIYIVLVTMSLTSTHAIDNLSKFKIKLTQQFKPQNEWHELHLDKTFKLKYDDPDSYIKMPSCLHAYEDKLLIVDNLGNKVVTFSNSNGTFMNSFGHRGRGPGEVSHPIWLETYNNKMYLRSENGVDIFDKNWKFEKRIRIFIPFRKFYIIKDNLYFGFNGPYKDKYPLFLKIKPNGMVDAIVTNKDINDEFSQRTKGGLFILPAGEHIIAVPMHWNMLYQYDQNLNLVKKKKIDYPLLDKIEDWNATHALNKKQPRFIWPCNLIQNIRFLDNKIYIFLNLPSRVEILVLDTHGNIDQHFYNTDFPLMRWSGFDVRKGQEGEIVFYILGYSFSDEEDDMLEFNAYRLEYNENKHTKGKAMEPGL